MKKRSVLFVHCQFHLSNWKTFIKLLLALSVISSSTSGTAEIAVDGTYYSSSMQLCVYINIHQNMGYLLI